MSIVRIFHNIEEMSRYTADFIREYAVSCIREHSFFTLVLSGGSTPRRLYELLASKPFRESIPWKQTHIFWGDERCVPPDHPESNYHMAAQSFLDHVPLPPSNIHRIKCDINPSIKAAEDYESEIRDFFKTIGCEPFEFPVFDLILLGIGADGHTASLFPGNETLQERKRWVSATCAPSEMPVEKRITLTLPVIDAARRVLFLISGEKKRDIVRTLFNDPDAIDLFPGAMIEERAGVFWFLDFTFDEKEKQ
jgi:6-phosphogluconolactonase